jgi:hypothetical protein
MIKPLTPEELGILFQEIEFEPTGKLSELAKVAGLNLAVDYVGVDLSGDNLSEDDLAGVNFSGSNLSNVNFKNTKLTNSNLSMAILIDANLQGANLSGADLSGADLSGADLSGADLSDANLQGSNFRNANLSDAYFIGVSFKEVNFSGANLSGITFDLDITENFCTQDSCVQVSLNVVVNVKIANLIDLKHYPSQDIGIKDLMEESITSTVREYLNQIEPDRFYMRFFQYSEEMNEKRSVEEELKEAIKEVLENLFFAQVTSIVTKPCETEMTQVYRDLNKEVWDFYCFVLKCNKIINLKGNFVVQAIEKDSWYTFKSQLPTKEQIKNSIERSLKAHLNTYENSLQYVDSENRKKIGEDIKKIVKDNIIDQYGLEINLMNFTCQLTSLEKKKEEYIDNINTLYIDVKICQTSGVI